MRFRVEIVANGKTEHDTTHAVDWYGEKDYRRRHSLSDSALVSIVPETEKRFVVLDDSCFGYNELDLGTDKKKAVRNFLDMWHQMPEEDKKKRTCFKLVHAYISTDERHEIDFQDDVEEMISFKGESNG